MEIIQMNRTLLTKNLPLDRNLVFRKTEKQEAFSLLKSFDARMMLENAKQKQIHSIIQIPSYFYQ